VFDGEPVGFGVRGTPSGPVWFLRYQLDKKRHDLRIGRVSDLGIDKARRIARDARAEIAKGHDPILGRRERIQADKAKRRELEREASRPTVAEFAKRYLEEHAEPHKKPSSVASDRAILAQTIHPRLGDIRVVDLDLAAVKRFHAALRGTPYRANRALALLSTMLAKAEQWGERPLGSNPCPAIDRYPERKRERYLRPAEAAELVKVLDAATGRERDDADAVLLLLLTGCRKGEIVALAWREVDFDAECLRLADSKTGARTIPLGAPALALLRRRHAVRISNEHVFCREDGAPVAGIDASWRRFRDAAKLGDVRVHDLRHSFAAAGIAAGLTLPEVGRLLGHRAAATTARYAHVADEVAREAARRVAEHLAETTRTGKPRLRAVR
jgi:integrase